MAYSPRTEVGEYTGVYVVVVEEDFFPPFFPEGGAGVAVANIPDM